VGTRGPRRPRHGRTDPGAWTRRSESLPVYPKLSPGSAGSRPRPCGPSTTSGWPRRAVLVALPGKPCYPSTRSSWRNPLPSGMGRSHASVDLLAKSGYTRCMKLTLRVQLVLKKILADGISNGDIAEWAERIGGWILELVTSAAAPRATGGSDQLSGQESHLLKIRAFSRRTATHTPSPRSPLVGEGGRHDGAVPCEVSLGQARTMVALGSATPRVALRVSMTRGACRAIQPQS
jgi:hypothetical protein